MPANPSPLTAPTADDLRAWYRVQSAALAHDRPGEPVPSQAAVQAGLTVTGSRSRLVLWLIRGSADEPVATSTLRVSTVPGDDRPGELRMTVHPAHRRLGRGSRLLSTVTEAAAAEGCPAVVAEVVSGTSGEGFLATRGFVPVQRLTRQRLPLDEVPEQIRKLPELPHPGYRLTAWEGAAPDALAEGLDGLRQAGGTEPWDAAEERESAELAARRGERLLTVAALDEAAGAVVGRTTVVLPAEGATGARQWDTAVLPAHRGNGLGLWMKAEMLRRLPAARPGLTEIRTSVADDNRHILAVNNALGFRPLRRTVRYRLRLRAR